MYNSGCGLNPGVNNFGASTGECGEFGGEFLDWGLNPGG